MPPWKLRPLSAMNKIVVTDGSTTFAEFLRQELEDEGYQVQLRMTHER